MANSTNIRKCFEDMNLQQRSFSQARFCDGGHKCLPPKECCEQGCCYMYAPPTAPRPTTPTINHVLNLFFINHWYFWCFVLAIVLALLCVCSLWKKRRQLCGWGASGHNYHSEGESTGSCYLPPQYSRCNSFHHAPPPYTEVTSKPDLYPLVFSYNGNDGGKGGPNYLMVQYFRNYIVRPMGSMSATSTIDSLSSSFIRSTNEANNLVPPPYSRAASPELPFSYHNSGNNVTQYAMQRSSSQQACSFLDQTVNNNNSNGVYRPCSVPNSNVHLNGSNINNSISASNSLDFQNYLPDTYDSENSNLSIMEPHGRMTTRTHSVNVNLNVNNDLLRTNIELVSVCDDDDNAAAAIVATPRHGVKQKIVANKSRSVDDDGDSIVGCYQGAHNSMSQYRKAFKMHKEQKYTSFESKESHICDYPKMNRHHSYLNSSNTDSSVSSLVNLGSPASPPRPTSPTSEVREILEQIRQIQTEADNAFLDTLDDFPNTETILPKFSIERHVSPGTHSPKHVNNCPSFNNSKPQQNSKNSVNQTRSSSTSHVNTNKMNKHFLRSSMYLPISNTINTSNSTTSHQRVLRNSMTSNCILSSRNLRGGGIHKSWMVSKSAPTTPAGTCLPMNLGKDLDSSPLLDEHDEDAEQNV